MITGFSSRHVERERRLAALASSSRRLLGHAPRWLQQLAGTHPEGSGARLIPYWSSQTASGVLGDATKATPEKGEAWLEAAVSGLVDLIRELRAQPILPRRDQH